MGSVRSYLSLVKFSHTIFAMPFAALGFTLGMRDASSSELLALAGQVLLCMVFARNTAMAFNRLVDASFDSQNPRTAVREIPAGVLRTGQVRIFVLLNAAAFVAVTWFINPLCFMLSPVALAVIMGYSYTKRFTALCHLVLGLGLALAPIGAYMAVTGSIQPRVILLGLAVMGWVGGFDIVYALQDEGFDRSSKLHSIPAWLGSVRALQVSRILHVISAISILLFSVDLVVQDVADWLWLAVADLIFIALLVYQHTLVRADDLRRVDLAFFTTNGLASLLFGAIVVTGVILG